MVQQYRSNPALNSMMSWLVARGWGPKVIEVLTVTGRSSGQPRTVPVSPISYDGSLCLVSPYGEVGWVKNARRAGRVSLGRGGRTRTYPVEKLSQEEAAPVLKAYLQRERMVRPYFEASPDSPLEELAAEARQHPVFRLHPVEGRVDPGTNERGLTWQPPS